MYCVLTGCGWRREGLITNRGLLLEILKDILVGIRAYQLAQDSRGRIGISGEGVGRGRPARDHVPFLSEVWEMVFPKVIDQV